ncbi:probable leucine-rich repeat receptor-like protein kinase At1g68400 [Diospyros lotus]|uniref:probable leucine-rich repeat receptor-like protein kinase At1g68400 n=1 Tax=Diospyros lotus TaxID=55363 RepID=UPI0022569ACD|nr:probable leucine-rich repeat receptor-like protein kinase At1g68400 [Diospyros lotus]
MESPQFFFISLALVFTFLASCNPAPAHNGPSSCLNSTERNALLALAGQFNNSFLNSNWISLQSHTPQWHGIRCSNGRVAGIVLESMGLAGKVKPDALAGLTELSILSFKNNSISGNLMDLSHNQKLRKIDLSGNMFDGLISDSLTKLNSLETLQLQDNRLTGSIPEFTQSSLGEFNVSNNRLSGPIANTGVLQSFSFSSFSGNRELCSSPSFAACKIANNTTSSGGTNNGDSSPSKSPYGPVFLALGVVGFVFLSFLSVIYFRKSRRLKRKTKKRSSVSREAVVEKIDEKKEVEASERCDKGSLTFIGEEGDGGFELNDLLKASAEGLGRGNFGKCYKAVLNDGSAMVVKRLRDLKPLSQDEFTKQLEAIADLKHPNLLPLTAFCYSKDEKLLVCKFASNGNVYNRIHGGRGTKERVPFRWNQRLSVARGAARALEYLHHSPISNPQAIVPHGNLKSTNVLLDGNDRVLVCDYGLGSLVSLPLVAQRMVAYRSPEYLSHKRVSKKSDVWSYGSLLLELLTGRMSALAAPQGVGNAVDLASWVHRAVREEWTVEVFDLEILAQRSANHSMLRLLQIAIRCCDKSPGKRPEMSEVAREVENIKMAVDSEEEDDGSVDQSFTDDSQVSA